MSAEHLLGADLQVANKRLASFDRNATAALDRALHALLWTRGAAFQGPVVLPPRFGRPIVAYASRIFGQVREAVAAFAGFVVLVDLEERLAPGEGALALVFSLTPAEARVMATIAAGKTVDEAARRVGVQANTVRMQLKSIFAKTGARRQADLRALALTLGRGPRWRASHDDASATRLSHL